MSVVIPMTTVYSFGAGHQYVPTYSETIRSFDLAEVKYIVWDYGKNEMISCGTLKTEVSPNKWKDLFTAIGFKLAEHTPF